MASRFGPSAIVQLVLPPALLSYFAWAFKCCNGVAKEYLSDDLRLPWLSAAYRTSVWVLIPSITVVYLRLFFLPKRQCVPPTDPPPQIERLETIFECAPPPRALRSGYALITSHSAEQDSLVRRCAKCSERWKPARARHCSDCGVCRAGFDHHCAFFANCLTAPYMPAFMALCTITPIAVGILISPMVWPLALRAREAWLASTTIPAARDWWAWKPSWVIPCGPVGRWAVGLSLAWLDLDRRTPGGAGVQRFELGALVSIGLILGTVTLALALSTLAQIRRGDLNIDFQRGKAYSRALGDAATLRQKGQTPSPALEARIARFAPQYWFFVPVEHEVYSGVVVPTSPGVQPYNAGWRRNFDLIVKRGRAGWFLPWNAVQIGMEDEVWNWPVAGGVEADLISAAEQVISRHGGS